MPTPKDDRVEKLDAIDLDQFDDFESEDFDEEDKGDDGRNAFVTALWEKHGFEDVGAVGASDRGAAIARALVIAHKMCQNYVDTFSTDDARYRVTFDPSYSTAGTDLVGKVIAISPSPVYDEKVTAVEAGLVLTAMATHEVSHVRYGRSTAAAVRRVFGNKRAPNWLSNLLDDVRIERRFADDYPGYRDVFRPMLDYIARSGKPGDKPPLRMSNLLAVAARAVRYAPYEDWSTPQLVAERDWWQAWADKWSKEDSPRRHVEAVREGLKHIVVTQEKVKIQDRKEKKPQKEPVGDALRLRDSMTGLTPLAQKATRLMGEGRSGLEIAATLGLSLDDAKILIRSTRRQLAGMRQTRVTAEAGENLAAILDDMDAARARVNAAREGGRR